MICAITSRNIWQKNPVFFSASGTVILHYEIPSLQCLLPVLATLKEYGNDFGYWSAWVGRAGSSKNDPSHLRKIVLLQFFCDN